jgi:hypothetical protein
VTAKKPNDDNELAQAKQAVRLAKAQLKKARKHHKAAKKAAKSAAKMARKARIKPPAAERVVAAKPEGKLARKAVKARKPKKVRRPPQAAPQDTMRSAAEVAKSVIERLQSPPPVLPPDPVIPEG